MIKMLETVIRTGIQGTNIVGFYNATTLTIMRHLQQIGYQALNMPELVDFLIETDLEGETHIFFSSSVIVVGARTGFTDPIVVYAHVPNLLSNPNDAEFAKTDYGTTYVNGKIMIPQSEFERLLDLKDDKRVFVFNNSELYRAGQGFLTVEKALEHPQTLGFFGDLERAEKYLGKFHPGGVDLTIPSLTIDEGYAAGSTFITASDIDDLGLNANINSQLLLGNYERILAKPKE